MLSVSKHAEVFFNSLLTHDPSLELEREYPLPIFFHAYDHPPAALGFLQAALEAAGRGMAVIGEFALGIVVMQQHGEARTLARAGHRRRTDYVRQA